MVESIVSYLAPMAERPFFLLYEPPEGAPSRNTRGDRRRVTIRDARSLDPAPSLDEEGFLLARHETAVGNLWDEHAVRGVYYAEMAALVKAVTGASRVVAFDHNVRSGAKAERREDGAQPPVRFPHNDYTERSGPQRVRDLFPREEAEGLLRRRFAVINVWKPIRGPVEETPLAVCDARTIRPEDFVPTDLLYRDRTGEVYSLRWSETHRWYYFPRMQADEAMLLKCFDTEVDRARFTAHTAFDDPTSPANPPARESIEVRTLAFFATGEPMG
ncbi:MAG: CmcJ/NvfI family oxidoreductase [Candidatus Binatia bacterium]